MRGAPDPAAERPITGMIEIDGKWYVRRFGLLVQRRLTCIFGHHIKLGEGHSFERSVPCGEMEQREAQVRCDAQVYLFMTRPQLLWAMDVTQEESALISREKMSPEQIVSHFRVGFPVDMKIARLQA